MEKIQLSKLPTKSTVLKYLHHLRVLMTAQKTLKKTTYSREKDCATMEKFKYDPSGMNEKLDWICAEIEIIKEFQAVVESKFTKLELTNTTPVQPVELNTFNEADMTPRQPEGMDATNKRVATSSQRQQCDLMGAVNKGDCFVFDLFKNRISQLENEISKKDEIISFLTKLLSVKNAFTIPLQNQSQERGSANNNPRNDSIELKYLGRKRKQLN